MLACRSPSFSFLLPFFMMYLAYISIVCGDGLIADDHVGNKNSSIYNAAMPLKTAIEMDDISDT